MRRSPTAFLVSLCIAACAAAVTTGEREACAQTQGFTVNKLEPSERGSMWFALDSLDFRTTRSGGARPAIGFVGDWQYRPLAIYAPDGTVRTSVIQHMATVHGGMSVAVGNAIRVGVSVPFIVFENGERGRLNGVTYLPPASEQSIGDIRLGGDLRLFGAWDGPMTAALGANIWLPTGDEASYTGDGAERIGPHLLVAGVLGAFTYSLKGAFTFRDTAASSFANGPIGHEFNYGGAIGLRTKDGRVVFGPELFGSTVLTDDTFKTRTTPLEGLLGFHVATPSGIHLGAAGGMGLSRGYGAPQARGLLSLEWMTDVPEDTDGDGIIDAEDACRTTPGVHTNDPKTNGCPVAAEAEPVAAPDRDGDRVPDASDACPDVAGAKSDDPKKNGCPPDADGDGIIDSIDACPYIAGVKTDDPKTTGCPPDRDGDGVIDAEDACPDQAGLKTSDPKTNGCPDLDRDKDGVLNDADACPDEAGKPDPDPKKNGCPKAFVQAGQIKIVDQVKFKTGSAVILPGKDSEEVLQAVAAVLKNHPEIKGVRVEGHTDNRGSAALNRKLSAGRAASVVKWLVAHGIEAGRLKSQGFGPDRPADSNATEAGRRNNRRVEFHIEETPATP